MVQGTSKPAFSRISYNIGAQIFALTTMVASSGGIIYLLYNTVPSEQNYIIFLLLGILACFGLVSMLQFWIENQLFKKILTVWQTNHLLLRSVVLTLFLLVSYFLYTAELLTFWSIILIILLFAIYLNWLSSIGKKS